MKTKQIHYSLGKLETDFQEDRNNPLAVLQTFKSFIIILLFFISLSFYEEPHALLKPHLHWGSFVRTQIQY